VIQCTGYSARNKFMTAGDLSEDCVNERGWINTDENFRVKDTDDTVIYAFGDCCTTGANVASIIMANYGNIVHNVLDELKDGRSGNKKKQCDNGGANMTVLTLGRDNGVADLPFGAFESVLPACKNKTFFIWRAMGFVEETKRGVDRKLVIAGLGVVGVGVLFAMRGTS